MAEIYSPPYKVESRWEQPLALCDRGLADSTVSDLSRVLLFVPTLNEERGLGRVLHQARCLGVPTLVVDGGSTDRTHSVARAFDVPFIQTERGKGRQWREFCSRISYSDWDYIAMIDSDATYDLNELPVLLAADGDMVIGRRVPTRSSSSILRKIGASSFSRLVTFLTSRRCQDLLSGFRIVRTSCLGEISIKSDGFGLESELTIEFLRRGLRVLWVDVNYYPRLGESKLHAARDGMDILRTIVYSRYRRL